MIELPKIGEKCQYYWDDGRSYRNGECVAYHANKAIILDDEDDTYTGCFAHQLRPIKTEAEKHRDRQIEAIHQTLSFAGDWYRDPKTVSEYLYKAGCRMTREFTKLDTERLWCGAAEMPVEVKTLHSFARAIEAHILGKNQ